MGFLKSISTWMENQYERKVNQMKTEGKCPDCKGIGFMPYLGYEYTYIPPTDHMCPGCNGSGTYDDWASNNG